MPLKYFYKNNLIFMSIEWMMYVGTWVYATLFPMILNKYYGYSVKELSYITSFFILFYVVSTVITNLLMDRRFHYFKILRYGFISLTISQFISSTIIYFHMDHDLYIISRTLEGISFGIIGAIISHIMKIKIYKLANNGYINSINTAIMYLLKTVIPIVSATFLIIHNFEISIYYSASLVFAVLTYIYIQKEEFLFKKYHMQLVRQRGITKNKTIVKIFINTLDFFKSKENHYLKMHYTLILILHNMLRPFFDLYISLLYINYYNFSISKVSIMLSFVALGQAAQILTGKMVDRINLFYYGMFYQILLTFSMITILYRPNEIISNYYVYILFFIMGFARSIFQNYQYKYSMLISNIGIKINHVSLISTFISETSHYFAYLLYGILLSLFLTIKTLSIMVIIILILQLIVWATFDYKNFAKK